MRGTDRLLWATVCLFVLTVTWNGIRLGGGAFGNAFLVLAFLGLVAHVLVSRQPLPLPPWLLLVGLALFLAQMLSLVFPPDVGLVSQAQLQLKSLIVLPVFVPTRPDLSAWFKFEVSVVLVPVLMLTAAGSFKRCLRLLDLFVVSATISSAVGFINHLGVDLGFGLGFVPADGRAAGLAIHPNYLAVGATIAIPTAMLWLARLDGRWRAAGMVAVPTLLLGVLASGSRAGAVTAVFAVALMAVFVPRLRHGLRLALPVAGMTLVFALLFTHLGQQILDQVRLSGSSDVSGSDYQRRVAADVAFDQIRSRPVQGVGFSAIADAHNIYLQLLAAGGVIALAAFAVFCAGLTSAARGALRGPGRDAAVAASLGIVLWLAGAIVGNEVADKFLYVVPGVLVALARVTRLHRLDAAQEDDGAGELLFAPATSKRIELERPVPA